MLNGVGIEELRRGRGHKVLACRLSDMESNQDECPSGTSLSSAALAFRAHDGRIIRFVGKDGGYLIG